jgi:hypothetical protein
MDTIWNIINIITAVISIASAVVAVTPSDKDNIWLSKRLKYVMPVLNALSLNIGNAKK